MNPPPDTLPFDTLPFNAVAFDAVAFETSRDSRPARPPSPPAAPPPAAILFFMPSIEIGGAEIAMVRLAAAFAAAGHRVALLVQSTASCASIAIPEPVELAVLGIRHTRSSPLALARFAADWQADAIIAALPHNNLAAIVAGLIIRRRGQRIGVVVTEHAPLPQLIAANRTIRYRILPLLQRLLYPHADAVVCASHGIADAFRPALPASVNLHTIYNPVVEGASGPPRPDRAAGEPDLIVAAGRLAAEKDYPALLRAFALLRRTRYVRLVIAGDGPERPRLVALAGELGIAGDVAMPGFSPDLPALLRQAAVFVLTSRFEGFGNVIVEALASGTPVVATDCPVGPREILQGGRFGTLVPPGDPAAIAAGIAAALDQPPDRAALRARASVFTVAASRAAYAGLIAAATPQRRPGLSVAIYMHDLSSGGVEHATLNLIGAFRAAGIAVTLLVHADTGPLRAGLPADLELINFATSRTIADLPGLVRYLRTRRPDILLANLDHNNLIATIASMIARTGTKLVIAQHNALSQEAIAMRSLKYRLLPLAYRLLAPRAHAIVAVSAGVAGDLAHCAGIARDRITVINNPVIDPAAIRPAATPPAGSHPWLTPDPSCPLFVTAGRLVAQKDHDTLIRAFALARRRQPMRLAILGEGPLRPTLEALALTLGIAADVILPGYIADPLPWFAAATGFVLSSRYEGFGNVLVEAMACGTPVISTNCPHGPAEILAGGRFGILVPVADPARLAETLDPELRRRWPADLLRARAARYDVAAAAAAYLALFERLRARPPRNRRRRAA